MQKCCVVAVSAVLACSCSRGPQPGGAPAPARADSKPLPSPYPDSFWSTWGGGTAEVSVFEIAAPAGSATAVTVFSVEQFSRSRRAGPAGPGSDTIPAMRMTVLRELLPGAGDSLTVFAALAAADAQPAGSVAKVVFSAHGWTGSVWRQLLPSPRHGHLSWRSTGADEGDGQSSLVYNEPQVAPEDSLPLVARRIAWPVLRLGQTAEFPAVPSLADRRIHTERGTAALKLSLSSERVTTEVPAGSFRTHTFTASWPGRKEAAVWHVEAAPPHRIVQWETSAGDRGLLRATGRFAADELKSPEGLRGVLRRLGVGGSKRRE